MLPKVELCRYNNQLSIKKMYTSKACVVDSTETAVAKTLCTIHTPLFADRVCLSILKWQIDANQSKTYW